jgi:hypothetical protein
MPRASQQHSGPFTYVLTSLLAISVLATAILLVLLIRPRPAARSISTSSPTAQECASEQHASYCYQVEITNDGDVDLAARCFVSAPENFDASFENGDSLVVTDQFMPGQVVPLLVGVTPTNEQDPVAPTVSCDPL